MDYTARGILQSTILEWAAFPGSRVSSRPRDRTQAFRIAGGSFTSWATGEAEQNKTLLFASRNSWNPLFDGDNFWADKPAVSELQVADLGKKSTY